MDHAAVVVPHDAETVAEAVLELPRVANGSIGPPEHRGVGGAAAAQEQRRGGVGVRDRVGGAAGKRQPPDTNRVSVEGRPGRRRTTHTQIRRLTSSRPTRGSRRSATPPRRTRIHPGICIDCQSFFEEI
eukprot:GHVU01078920.1.p1 GENE.GHVU01078920.1~~GHVU01078920.1.p1  ORF type:complete len:129 (+),score=9.56 GHVU01078920.1:155-541(+)